MLLPLRQFASVPGQLQNHQQNFSKTGHLSGIPQHARPQACSCAFRAAAERSVGSSRLTGSLRHARTVLMRPQASATSSSRGGGGGSSGNMGALELPATMAVPPPSTSIGSTILQLQTTPMALLHLSAWAQLGVLCRVTLAQMVGAAVSSWSVGILFVDLPANMVGCFVMGLLSPSDVLERLALRQPSKRKRSSSRSSSSSRDGSRGGGRSSGSDVDVLMVGSSSSSCAGTQGTHGGGSTAGGGAAPRMFTPAPEDLHRAIAALPGSSPVQKHASLLLGLRTGFCGSLTTFASWMLEVVKLATMPPQHSIAALMPQMGWLLALGSLLVGCAAAMASLITGQTVALMLWKQMAARRARTAKGLGAGLQPPAAEGHDAAMLLLPPGPTADSNTGFLYQRRPPQRPHHHHPQQQRLPGSMRALGSDPVQQQQQQDRGPSSAPGGLLLGWQGLQEAAPRAATEARVGQAGGSCRTDPSGSGPPSSSGSHGSSHSAVQGSTHCCEAPPRSGTTPTPTPTTIAYPIVLEPLPPLLQPQQGWGAYAEATLQQGLQQQQLQCPSEQPAGRAQQQGQGARLQGQPELPAGCTRASVSSTGPGAWEHAGPRGTAVDGRTVQGSRTPEGHRSQGPAASAAAPPGRLPPALGWSWGEGTVWQLRRQQLQEQLRQHELREGGALAVPAQRGAGELGTGPLPLQQQQQQQEQQQHACSPQQQQQQQHHHHHHHHHHDLRQQLVQQLQQLAERFGHAGHTDHASDSHPHTDHVHDFQASAAEAMAYLADFTAGMSAIASTTSGLGMATSSRDSDDDEGGGAAGEGETKGRRVGRVRARRGSSGQATEQCAHMQARMWSGEGGDSAAAAAAAGAAAASCGGSGSNSAAGRHPLEAGRSDGGSRGSSTAAQSAQSEPDSMQLLAAASGAGDPTPSPPPKLEPTAAAARTAPPPLPSAAAATVVSVSLPLPTAATASAAVAAGPPPSWGPAPIGGGMEPCLPASPPLPSLQPSQHQPRHPLPPPPLQQQQQRQRQSLRRNRRMALRTIDLLMLGLMCCVTLVAVAHLTADMGAGSPGVLAVVARATHHFRQPTYVWASLLLAPVGCLLRWWLSKVLGSVVLKKAWAWVPAGTLVTNCLACLLDFVVSFLLQATGVGSNLSTLSAWVVEIQKLNAKKSKTSSRGTLYMALSVIMACGMGVICYLLGDPASLSAGRAVTGLAAA